MEKYSIDYIVGFINRKEPLPKLFNKALSDLVNLTFNRGLYALTLEELLDQLQINLQPEELSPNFFIRTHPLYKLVSVLRRNKIHMIPMSVPNNLLLTNTVHLLKAPELTQDPDIAGVQELQKNSGKQVNYTASQIATLQNSVTKLNNYNILIRVFEGFGAMQTRALDVNQRSALSNILNERILPHDGNRYIRCLFGYVCDYGSYTYDYQNPLYVLQPIADNLRSDMIDIIARVLSASKVKLQVLPTYPFAKELQAAYDKYCPTDQAMSDPFVVHTQPQKVPVAMRPLSKLSTKQKQKRLANDLENFKSRITDASLAEFLRERPGLSSHFIQTAQNVTIQSDPEFCTYLQQLNKSLLDNTSIRLMLPDLNKCELYIETIDIHAYIRQQHTSMLVKGKDAEPINLKDLKGDLDKGQGTQSKNSKGRSSKVNLASSASVNGRADAIVDGRTIVYGQAIVDGQVDASRAGSAARADNRGTSREGSTQFIDNAHGGNGLTSVTGEHGVGANSYGAKVLQTPQGSEPNNSNGLDAPEQADKIAAALDAINHGCSYTSLAQATNLGECFNAISYTWDELTHFYYSYLIYAKDKDYLHPNVDEDYGTNLEQFLKQPLKQIAGRLNYINMFEFVIKPMLTGQFTYPQQQFFEIQMGNVFLFNNANPLPYLFCHSLFIFDKYLMQPRNHFNNEVFYLTLLTKEPFAINIYLTRIINKYGNRLANIPEPFYVLIVLQMILFPQDDFETQSFELANWLLRSNFNQVQLSRVVCLHYLAHRFYCMVHDPANQLQDLTLELIHDAKLRSTQLSKLKNKDDPQADMSNSNGPRAFKPFDLFGDSCMFVSKTGTHNSSPAKGQGSAAGQSPTSNPGLNAGHGLGLGKTLGQADDLEQDSDFNQSKAIEQALKRAPNHERKSESGSNWNMDAATSTDPSKETTIKHKYHAVFNKKFVQASPEDERMMFLAAARLGRQDELYHVEEYEEEKVSTPQAKNSSAPNADTSLLNPVTKAKKSQINSKYKIPDECDQHLNTFFMGDVEANYIKSSPFGNELTKDLNNHYVMPIVKRLLSSNHRDIYMFNQKVDISEVLDSLNQHLLKKRFPESTLDTLPSNRFIIDSFILEDDKSQLEALRLIALNAQTSQEIGFAHGIPTEHIEEIAKILFENLQLQLVPDYLIFNEGENYSHLRPVVHYIKIIPLPKMFQEPTVEVYAGYLDVLFSLRCATVALELVRSIISLVPKTQELIATLVKEVITTHRLQDFHDVIAFAYNYINASNKLIDKEGRLDIEALCAERNRLDLMLIGNRGLKRFQRLLCTALSHLFTYAKITPTIESRCFMLFSRIRLKESELLEKLDRLFKNNVSRLKHGAFDYPESGAETVPVEIDMEKVRSKLQESSEVQDVISKVREEEAQREAAAFEKEQMALKERVALYQKQQQTLGTAATKEQLAATTKEENSRKAKGKAATVSSSSDDAAASSASTASSTATSTSKSLAASATKAEKSKADKAKADKSKTGKGRKARSDTKQNASLVGGTLQTKETVPEPSVTTQDLSKITNYPFKATDISDDAHDNLEQKLQDLAPIAMQLSQRARKLIEAVQVQNTEVMDLREFNGLCVYHRYMSANSAIEEINDLTLEEYGDLLFEAAPDQGVMYITKDILEKLGEECARIKELTEQNA